MHSFYVQVVVSHVQNLQTVCQQIHSAMKSNVKFNEVVFVQNLRTSCNIIDQLMWDFGVPSSPSFQTPVQAYLQEVLLEIR